MIEAEYEGTEPKTKPVPGWAIIIILVAVALWAIIIGASRIAVLELSK